MKNPSEEDLLGYVLGALDAQEQRDVQHSLDNNPRLEERLLDIKSAIVPLDYLDTGGSRPGLARRTCELVANQTWDQPLPAAGSISETWNDNWDQAPASSDKTIRISAGTEPVGAEPAANTASNFVDLSSARRFLQPSTWSLPDFAAAVALMAIVAGILFPTLSYTRYNSRLMACQNNMRQLGTALLNFSETHNGRFVEIPRSGPLAAVGSFAPILKDCGLVDDDSMFACAGVASDSNPVHIPSLETLASAKGKQLCYLQRVMSGHYGYSMGSCGPEGYLPPQNMGRTNVVLLADMPSLTLVGRRSANHGGRGQNCLFEDGHVKFVSGDSVGEDPIFFNDYNLVAPGCRPEDNVIAPSHLSPALAQTVPYKD